MRKASMVLFIRRHLLVPIKGQNSTIIEQLSVQTKSENSDRDKSCVEIANVSFTIGNSQMKNQ